MALALKAHAMRKDASIGLVNVCERSIAPCAHRQLPGARRPRARGVIEAVSQTDCGARHVRSEDGDDYHVSALRCCMPVECRPRCNNVKELVVDIEAGELDDEAKCTAFRLCDKCTVVWRRAADVGEPAEALLRLSKSIHGAKHFIQ